MNNIIEFNINISGSNNQCLKCCNIIIDNVSDNTLCKLIKESILEIDEEVLVKLNEDSINEMVNAVVNRIEFDKCLGFTNTFGNTMLSINIVNDE